MDYESLRREGLKELERLAGAQWTDFNPHDPGITLLEQVCYALTDLGYRTEHEIQDLLAEGGRDPYAGLHKPGQILTCRPVTPQDLRRVVLDVEGVRNAWVEPLREDAPTFDERPAGGTPSSGPLRATPVALKGLYRALIEVESDADSAKVRGDVARRLYENRGLCEDFAEITVVGIQDVLIDVAVEVGPLYDALPLGREIFEKLREVVSPTVRRRSPKELLLAGMSPEAVWDGPQLVRGYLTDEALEEATRRSAINASDLIRAIKEIEGPMAVSRVRIGATDPLGDVTWRDWSLKVQNGKVARLSPKDLKITFRRAGKVVASIQGDPSFAEAAPRPRDPQDAPALPSGRDRHVYKYTSVRRHLPAVYGVGELGLAQSAPPERRARAKQLKGYLRFFDQIMANHLAQLAHVADLLSYEGEGVETYFAQPLDEPPEELISSALEQAPAPPESDDVDLARKNRFLSHLLARFAETVDDHGEPSGDHEERSRGLAERKRELLRRYPDISGARGALSGLSERIRLRLGLEDDEMPILIERILLRPLEGEQEPPPLPGATLRGDPYSLQLICVLPGHRGRFAGERDWRALVEQTIREEAPAHISVHFLWKSNDEEWGTLKRAHDACLKRWEGYWSKKLGLPRGDSP